MSTEQPVMKAALDLLDPLSVESVTEEGSGAGSPRLYPWGGRAPAPERRAGSDVALVSDVLLDEGQWCSADGGDEVAVGPQGR